MNTPSGSHFIKAAKDAFSLSTHEAPTSSKQRLEDIINDLVSMETFTPTPTETGAESESEMQNAQNLRVCQTEEIKVVQKAQLRTTPKGGEAAQEFPNPGSGGMMSKNSGNFSVQSAQARLEEVSRADAAISHSHLPVHSRIPAKTAEFTRSMSFDAIKNPWEQVRQELKIPADLEAAFNYLKNFQQTNRHRPLIELGDEHVLYVEYDPEMERVRIFKGLQDSCLCLHRCMREVAAVLTVDEIFEFKLDTRPRDLLGFKRSKLHVNLRHREGRDLLTPREAADKSIGLVLHFKLFSEPGAGISSCLIKAEKV